MIFTIKVNGQTFLVEEDTIAEAVCCAMNSYVTSLADSPDSCTMDLDTMPVTIQSCGVTESLTVCEEEVPVP